jgi:hypothetical protein
VTNHVVGLFPNTRGSGNPLIGKLPESIGRLQRLQHLYTRCACVLVRAKK